MEEEEERVPPRSITVCDNCFRPPPKGHETLLQTKECGHVVCQACEAFSRRGSDCHPCCVCLSERKRPRRHENPRNVQAGKPRRNKRAQVL